MDKLLKLISVVNTTMTLVDRGLEFGKNVGPTIQKVIAITGKGALATDQDIAELQAESDALSAELQTPIPPEQARPK